MKKTHKGSSLQSMLLTVGILSGVYSVGTFLQDYSKNVEKVKIEVSPTSNQNENIKVSLHK